MIGQIFLNSSERFQVDAWELTSGDPLEVLVVDGAGQPHWVRTSVEHNGTEYYLTGLQEYSPVGLFAKL